MAGRPQIRPLAPADTGAIVSLYERSMQTEPTIGPVTPEQWERFLRAPQNQRAHDFRVAVLDGVVVGLAESSLRQQAGGRVRYVKLVVDPAQRRRGIATDLLRTVVEIDGDDVEITLHGQTRDGWTAGEAFLVAMGFQYLESDFTMVCRTLRPIASRAENGMTVSRIRDPLVHATDVARIHNAAFAADVAFHPLTPDEMAEDLRNEGDDLWLAHCGDAVVGFCRIEKDDGGPWLESLAVDPAYHGRGIGSHLAHDALAAYGISENRRAGLSVSSHNPNARRIYDRLGFVERAEKRRHGCARATLFTRLTGRTTGT